MPTFALALLAAVLVPLLEKLLPELTQEVVDAIEHLVTTEQVKRNPIPSGGTTP